jgi:hypothetical protein
MPGFENTPLRTLIYVFLQIRQAYWCLCLTEVWHESLQKMEGTEKPHTDKYKEITNNWNYDANCTVTSLPVRELENFKRLIFVVQRVQSITTTHSLTACAITCLRM